MYSGKSMMCSFFFLTILVIGQKIFIKTDPVKSKDILPEIHCVRISLHVSLKKSTKIRVLKFVLLSVLGLILFK